MTNEDTGVSGFSGDRGDVRGNQLVEAPDFLGCSWGFWCFNPIGPQNRNSIQYSKVVAFSGA